MSCSDPFTALQPIHQTNKQAFVAKSSSALTGTVCVPGDKSISHRAFILAALSNGQTPMIGVLESEDVLATARAIQHLGAQATRVNTGEWVVHGVGTGGFQEPNAVIDCGNAGTGVRLLMGAVATTPISVTFTGDSSLCGRPMGRIQTPLGHFGTRFYGRQSGSHLPLTVVGTNNPVPIHYTLPIASAQVKSAILLAALNTRGQTTIIEPALSRDHTERMLIARNVDLTLSPLNNGNTGQEIVLQGPAEIAARAVTIPSDPSSAAFPIAAALITQGSAITLPNVGVNPLRTGLLTTLQDMGANITLHNQRLVDGEPIADIAVAASALRGVNVPPERAPVMIDEYPILSIIAANAKGSTHMQGIGELRVKETDRIFAVEQGLNACGVHTESTQDTLTIHGQGANTIAGGAECQTFFDHRIAMSFLCLGLASQNPIQIDDGRAIATSFPNFIALMQGIGANIENHPKA